MKSRHCGWNEGIPHDGYDRDSHRFLQRSHQGTFHWEAVPEAVALFRFMHTEETGLMIDSIRLRQFQITYQPPVFRPIRSAAAICAQASLFRNGSAKADSYLIQMQIFYSL